MSLPVLDRTHDLLARSWVEAANGDDDFPIQNLPIGVFSHGNGSAGGGVAIGDQVFDLRAGLDAGLFVGDAEAAARAAAAPTLNAWMALGRQGRQALRARLFEILEAGSASRAVAADCLRPQAEVTLHLPALVGDYTDFYVGIHHALNVGRQMRPDNPLLPNYKHLPIGYHGRASTIVASGAPFRRPRGQVVPSGATIPEFGPTRRLDFELELGVWIGSGNLMGAPIPIAEAPEHVAGYCLLNDWSARDIQAWEYQPLGPFLAKNFATTVSPWVVTPEALAPFRAPLTGRSSVDPALLPYLSDEADQRAGGLDVVLEAWLLTPAMAAAGARAERISASNTSHMYWSVSQMVAHHTVGGCSLNPGDLLGTGTISGAGRDECGSLMELTLGGREPMRLPSGESRAFLEDGDELILKARARRDGFAAIGFGECRGRVTPSL